MRQFVDGDFPFAAEFESVFGSGYKGETVLEGCEVTHVSGYDLSVDAGRISTLVSTSPEQVTINSQTFTLDAFPEGVLDADGQAFDIRFDLVVANPDGTVGAITGTKNKRAEPLPADAVLLAVVWVEPGLVKEVFDSRVVSEYLVAAKLRVYDDLVHDVVTGAYGNVVGQTLPEGQQLEIPNGRCMVVADEYTSEGNLEVNGTLKII